MKKFIIIILLVFLILSVLALVFLRILPDISKQKSETSGIIEVSGIIEAIDTEIRAQTPGEIKQIFVKEGQPIERGDLLCTLDNEKLYLQINQIKAGQDGAQAKLKLFEKGTKKELIAVAKNQIESTQKQLEIAGINRDRMDRLFKEGAVSKIQKEEADLKFKLALEQNESAKENYELAVRGREKEEIEMIRAEIRNLEAKEQLLRRQIKDSEVRAPSDGFIDIRHIEIGELASPGTILFTLIDLTRTYVKAYIPEKYMGNLKTGNLVEVISDSFPNRAFKGKIDFISDKAEFAPKDIQTKEERLKLVFMIKSYLENPQRELKPGMPVDVRININDREKQ